MTDVSYFAPADIRETFNDYVDAQVKASDRARREDNARINQELFNRRDNVGHHLKQAWRESPYIFRPIAALFVAGSLFVGSEIAVGAIKEADATRQVISSWTEMSSIDNWKKFGADVKETATSWMGQTQNQAKPPVTVRQDQKIEHIPLDRR